MTPLRILLAAVFLGTGNCSSKIVNGKVENVPNLGELATIVIPLSTIFTRINAAALINFSPPSSALIRVVAVIANLRVCYILGKNCYYTFRTLLHLGQNVITFGTLLHLRKKKLLH